MKLKFENLKKHFDDFCLKIFFLFKKTNRKFIIFTALAVFLLMLVFPANKASAQESFSLVYGAVTSLAEWLGLIKSAPSESDLINYAADSILSVTIYPLVYFICAILLNLFNIGVVFAAWLVDVFINPNVYSSVFNSSAIRIGWETIRDISNTFFVMILLLIAFATILRIQTYSAKNLFPKFIIAIFLINFSAEITKIVIDIGQIFMFEIRSWMGTFGGSTGWGGSAGTLTSIVGHFRDVYLNWGFLPEDLNFGHENVVGIIFALAFTVVLMFVYLLLAIFLLLRLVYLAVMIVLSPLAFLGIVLPGLNKYTGDFWSKLFSNSISGAVLLFFVFLATQMANELTSTPPVITPPTGDDLNIIQSSIAYVVPFSVSIVMLLFSVSAAQKLGAAGAGSIIGGVGGIGKIAIGTWGGMKLAGGLGRAVGAPIARRTGLSDWASRKYEGVKDRVKGSQIARDTGVAKWMYKGDYSAFKKNRGEVEDKKNYYKKASTKGRYDEILNGAWKGKSNNDIAAVIESMVEKKELTHDKMTEHLDEGQIKNLEESIPEALLRAKSSFDVPKLRESMPQYAAMIELGKTGKESDDSKKAVDEKTAEFMKENVAEGKLSSLDRSSMENPVNMRTIMKEHDDFDGWVKGRSATDKQSIGRGLEGIYLDMDEKLRKNNLGDIDNITDDESAVKEKMGVSKESLQKEIKDVRMSLAKSDKNGHNYLKEIDRDGDGAIKKNPEDGRIAFKGNLDPGMAQKFVDSSMRDKGDIRAKSVECFAEIGKYLNKEQFKKLLTNGSVDQQRAARESYLNAHQGETSEKVADITKYLKGNTAYGSLGGEAEEAEPTAQPTPQQPRPMSQQAQTSTPPQQVETEGDIDRKYNEKLNRIKAEKENKITEADKKYNDEEKRIKMERGYLNAGSATPATKEKDNQEYDEELTRLQTERESQKKEANRNYDEGAEKIEKEKTEAKTKEQPEAKPGRAESAEAEPQEAEPAGAEEPEARGRDGEIVEKLNEINNEIKTGFESLKSASPGEKKDKVENFIGKLGDLTKDESATSNDEIFKKIIDANIKARNEVADNEEEKSGNQKAGERLVGINKEINETNEKIELGNLSPSERGDIAERLTDSFNKLTEEYAGMIEKFPGHGKIEKSLEKMKQNAEEAGYRADTDDDNE